MIDGSTIEDVPIGLTATFTKTVAESDVYMFAGITGDLDRNHVDEEYCHANGFAGRIAHGALIVGFMSTTSTLVLQGFRSPALSLGYDRVRFTKPVFIGDTITVEYKIVAKDIPKSRTIAEIRVENQRGETVAVATHIQKIL